MPTSAPPRWNLDPLFSGDRSASLDHCLAQIEKRTDAYCKIPKQWPIIAENEDELADIFDLMCRAEVYCRLNSATHEGDLEVQGELERTAACVAKATKALLPYVHLFAKVDDPAGDASFAFRQRSLVAKCAQTYARQNRFQLSEPLQGFYNDLTTASAQALRETRKASLRTLGADGQSDLSAERKSLRSPDPVVRQQAWKKATAELRARDEVHTQIYNGWLSHSNTLADWAGAPSPADIRHASNDLDSSAVEELCSAVRSAYPRFAHRFYSLKAERLGMEKLSFADRLAPMGAAIDTRYSWEEAKTLILQSFEPIALEFEAAARLFFDRRWIDAQPRQNKDAGGFCLPGPSSANPFILVNFDGSPRSVLELAHELGHGVHYYLSQKSNRIGVTVPFPVAETAAIFAEQLTFAHMIEQAPPDTRTALIIGRAHDFVNTVFRHMALYDFEIRAHEARKAGPLSTDYLRNLFETVHEEALGDSFKYDGSLGSWYFTVPHFFNWPFYTYAYAFGEIMAATLHLKRSAGDPQFEENYMTFLSHGGALSAQSLFKIFEVDLSEPQVWIEGLTAFDGLMEEVVNS